MRTVHRPITSLLTRNNGKEALRLPNDSAAGYSLVVGWLRLAVASLAVAGLFALLVAVARTPVVQGFVGEGYFRISLVAHVTFSLNVWSLSFAAALWALALARLRLSMNRTAGRASLLLASAGAAVMSVMSVAGSGRASLVDYIPVLEQPLFIGGLATFFAGIGLGAVNFLVAIRQSATPLPLYAKALRIAAVTYLMAMLTFLVALNAGWEFDWGTMVWGPGHLLQVVNAASMIAVWMLMVRTEGDQGLYVVVRAVLPFFFLPAVVVPFLYLFPGPPLLGMIGGVTWAGVTIPTVAAWLVTGTAVVRRREKAETLVPLVVSLLLFAGGAIAAMLGLEDDTRVTAHYHGTVGAVTVAYMGLTYQLLPMLGLSLRLPRLARLQLTIHG
jgi:hypothetical protein